MKDIRRQLDLSLTEMAELLGVKKSTIAKYEQGQRPLPTTGRTLMERLAMELYLPKERPTNAPGPCLTQHTIDVTISVRGTRTEADSKEYKYSIINIR
jgi:transcriptional regulator with XRE-family HTH domain